ncbi:MAG: hydroxymethylpyrimidine/phosphomethylpyrimidine kinase [Burkholderiales bacterium]|uniref:bifunctional hydroxymethylpyrimidine kinase/phosphomethylpyrimidine kinase n=1 Tax=Nitrosomonas sp. TaxID=42353 RepID=UPI001E16766E|nr:hydroxymethylpyrimidine/phosphomethylpyrimidine kinase [Nitrosomonas sp.]MCB1947603.1 hydroxymethylpyrimidine/phosphomethylpyrimidine kinase [Nitrosomonas sp.]MCP5242263.1 hydroxymethylpyrimidine/phosphomethylpyrimidine kinase [Burkholderiales bacterium]
MSQPPPNVLSFAASDPSCGAGSQADIMTIASIGCHPLSVITAITVQDTSGVHDIYPLDSGWVARQARTILDDMPVQAIKLGLLGSDKIIHVIAEILSAYPHIPVVMDPVLASGRGDELTTAIMMESMCELLLPRVTLLTPNSLEARRLAFIDACLAAPPDNSTLDECASRLLEMGCEYILITGTHENTAQVTNLLFTHDKKLRADNWNRLPHNYHGSGCTLASAIAAFVATGQTVPDSVFSAQSYTWHTLEAGFQPGRGQFIPNRYFQNNIP